MKNENKKYKLTKETINVLFGHTLYRIKATKTFTAADGSVIKKGQKGGFIEKEENLSHEDRCWIFDNAKVYGNAKVIGSGYLHDNAQAFDNAIIEGRLYDNAKAYGNAKVMGNKVMDNNFFNTVGELHDNTKVFDNANVSGRFFNNVKVYGDAHVLGSHISDDSIIYGNAVVKNSVINNKCVIKDYAQINKSEILDNATICGAAKIFLSSIHDNCIIKDKSIVIESTIKDDVVISENANINTSDISNCAEISGKACIKYSIIKDNVKISDRAHVENATCNNNVVINKDAVVRVINNDLLNKINETSPFSSNYNVEKKMIEDLRNLVIIEDDAVITDSVKINVNVNIKGTTIICGNVDFNSCKELTGYFPRTINSNDKISSNEDMIKLSIKKYELTNDTIELEGCILSRIRALRDFGDIKAGELGGYIEKEENLSHDGNCWVKDNAKVYNFAKVLDDAEVKGNAILKYGAVVCNNACIKDDAILNGMSIVSDGAIIGGDTKVGYNAKISGYVSIVDVIEIDNVNICSYNDLMVYKINHPPKLSEDFIKSHMCTRANAIDWNIINKNTKENNFKKNTNISTDDIER